MESSVESTPALAAFVGIRVTASEGRAPVGLRDNVLLALDRGMEKFQQRRKELGDEPQFQDLKEGENFLSDHELGEAVRLCGNSEELWRLFLARGKPIRTVIEFETRDVDELAPIVTKKWAVDITYRAAEVKIRTTEVEPS
jgi:hypothetical protein